MCTKHDHGGINAIMAQKVCEDQRCLMSFQPQRSAMTLGGLVEWDKSYLMWLPHA